jgi:hypothetical protein
MIESNNPDLQRNGPQAGPERELFWRERLLRQQRSGLSIRAFCQEHDIAIATFYMWRSRIGRRERPVGTAAQFVELRAVPTQAAVAPAVADASIRHDAPLELLLGDDRRLLIRAGCDAALLREVLAVLSPASLPAVSPSNQPAVSLLSKPVVSLQCESPNGPALSLSKGPALSLSKGPALSLSKGEGRPC